MRGWGLLFLLFACWGNLAAAEYRLPRTFVLDPKTIAEHRAAYRGGDKRFQAVVNSLRADAERALRVQPLSVTQKPETAPSGDKHDYLSHAPYFWPNPARSDGLPYVRRDGEQNHEALLIPDHSNLERVIKSVSALAFGAYFVGEPAYAAHAQRLVRVWFLDPATRMKPNLNYAQLIKGEQQGNPAGIIETHLLTVLVDALALLAESNAWSAREDEEMKRWCDAYLGWLRESANGKREARATNNHGTWYDAQVSALALFLGDDDAARAVLEASKNRRIALQVAPDGRQPEELKRTRSLSYSLFNLEGWFTLAALGERLGIDLWAFQTADGRSLRGAFEFLLPALTGQQKWPYAQITNVDPRQYGPLVYQAARQYRQPRYRLAYEQLAPGATAKSKAALLYGDIQSE